MQNNIYLYLALIPILFLFYALKSKTTKKIVLILFSYFIIFLYDTNAFDYLVFSTFINFGLFKFIKNKHRFAQIAIGLNIGVFIFIKFILIPKSSFFIDKESLAYVFLFLSTIRSITWIKENCLNFSSIDYLFHSAFFPKVLFMPGYQIENLDKSLDKSITENEVGISKGIFLFSLGLFQINILSQFLHFTYTGAEPCASMNFVQAITVILANTVEITLNLWGYLNICRAITLILGFDEPINQLQAFNKKSLTLFWNSYYPLLLSPITALFKKFNIGKQFAISLSLILFTVLFYKHATILIFLVIQLFSLWILNISTIKRLLEKFKMVSWLITFVIINISFLFFRMANMSEINVILKGLFSIGSVFLYYNELYILWSINANFISWTIILVSLYYLSRQRGYQFKPNKLNLLIAFIFSIVSIAWFYKESTFILHV